MYLVHSYDVLTIPDKRYQKLSSLLTISRLARAVFLPGATWTLAAVAAFALAAVAFALAAVAFARESGDSAVAVL